MEHVRQLFAQPQPPARSRRRSPDDQGGVQQGALHQHRGRPGHPVLRLQNGRHLENPGRVRCRTQILDQHRPRRRSQGGRHLQGWRTQRQGHDRYRKSLSRLHVGHHQHVQDLEFRRADSIPGRSWRRCDQRRRHLQGHADPQREIQHPQTLGKRTARRRRQNSDHLRRALDQHRLRRGRRFIRRAAQRDHRIHATPERLEKTPPQEPPRLRNRQQPAVHHVQKLPGHQSGVPQHLQPLQRHAYFWLSARFVPDDHDVHRRNRHLF